MVFGDTPEEYGVAGEMAGETPVKGVDGEKYE